MNNKAEVLIRHLIFGAIILSMLTFATTTMISGVIEKNSHMAGNNLKQFNDTFNKNEEILTNRQTIESSVNSTSIEDFPIFGPTASLIKTTWAYVKGTISSLGFVTGIFTSGLSSAGVEIPGWVGPMIVSMIIFLIGFVIIGLIFKGKI